MYLNYEFDDYSTEEAVIDLLYNLILTFCLVRKYKTTVHIMPTFKPTEYLFKTHADKGKERWQIYAWAIKNAMSKQSGRPSSEASTREKRAYKKYLAGSVDIADFESKTIEQIVEEYNMQIEDKKKE
jgi:hypothetical protein